MNAHRAKPLDNVVDGLPGQVGEHKIAGGTDCRALDERQATDARFVLEHPNDVGGHVGGRENSQLSHGHSVTIRRQWSCPDPNNIRCGVVKKPLRHLAAQVCGPLASAVAAWCRSEVGFLVGVVAYTALTIGVFGLLGVVQRLVERL